MRLGRRGTPGGGIGCAKALVSLPCLTVGIHGDDRGTEPLPQPE